MIDWAALEQQAQGQYGLVSRRQLLAAGTRSAYEHAVTIGRLKKTDFRNVYRLAGTSMESWQAQASAAQLRFAPGSALSHTTAATIWGLDGYARATPTVFHVTVPRGRTCSDPRIRLHLTFKGPPPSEVRNHFIVTPVVRTLLDLASCVREDELEAALDSARRIHKLSAEFLSAQLAEYGQGKEGTTLLRNLIAKRTTPLDSRFEVFVAREVLARGLPTPVEHFVAFDSMGRRIMEIDFAWPDRLIALHCDSYQFHTDYKTFQDDLEKRARLAAAGWSNVVVGWKTLRTHTWSDAVKRLLSQHPS